MSGLQKDLQKLREELRQARSDMEAEQKSSARAVEEARAQAAKAIDEAKVFLAVLCRPGYCQAGNLHAFWLS